MALDIGFLDTHGKHDCRLQFECNGYYWFLHPWFKAFYQETGKYVDLYGDCHLHSGNGLLNLDSKISEALVAAQRQPSNWGVHIGTQLRPEVKELYSTVDRKRMIQVIEEFQALLKAGLQNKCSGCMSRRLEMGSSLSLEISSIGI